MVEPTKACVRVLRIENVILKSIRWIAINFLKFLSFCYDVIIKIAKYINLCILRAIVRWIGFPVCGLSVYYIIIRMSDAAFDMSFIEFFAACCVAGGIGYVTIWCWTEIPEREKEIIFKW